MKTITYNGPGHVLRLPSGREVQRGETAEVTDQDAASAQALPGINVSLEALGMEPDPQEEE